MSKFTTWFSRSNRDHAPTSATPPAQDEVEIRSPMEGSLIPLDHVEDALFSAGVMGPGIAVRPSVGELRAPFAGTVRAVFPTGHAVGMASDSGLEILMHIGLDTVDLHGAHFDTAVSAGQRVSAGDLLVSFDAPAIRDAGYVLTTPMVIVDTEGWALNIEPTSRDVRVGDLLFTASRVAGTSS